MAPQCEIPPALHRAEPFSNGLTFQHVMAVVSTICTALTVLLCFFLSERHLANFVCPEQQQHLARIAIVPAIFALFSLLSVIFYNASRYLEPFPKLYEAIAICSLFELCVAYVSPIGLNNAAARFRHISQIGRFANKKRGLLSVRLHAILIYQLPYVVLACLIATEVTSAVQCESNEAYQTSKKVIRLVGIVSTIVAIISVMRFHLAVRKDLHGVKAYRKLLGIKILAVVVIAETAVFSFVKPGTTQRWPRASYFDISVGIPNLLVCCEMVLFGLGWFYLFGRSSVQNSTDVVKVSTLAAFGQVVNISDIAFNTLAAFTARNGKEHAQLGSDSISDHTKTEDHKM